MEVGFYVASSVNESTHRPAEMQSKLLRTGRNALGARPFQGYAGIEPGKLLFKRLDRGRGEPVAFHAGIREADCHPATLTL